MRRIYFIIPDVPICHRIISELGIIGIPRSNIHALDNNRNDLTGLPIASKAQQKDRVWFLERFFWNGNLVIFLIALIGLALSTLNSSIPLAIATVVVMLVTFFLGNWFATSVPHAHLNEVQPALKHGEIVLMVDVPKTRISEIEQLVSHHNPVTVVGAIGWTIAGLGT